MVTFTELCRNVFRQLNFQEVNLESMVRNDYSLKTLAETLYPITSMLVLKLCKLPVNWNIYLGLTENAVTIWKMGRLNLEPNRTSDLKDQVFC